jgi:hypothetical protein
MRVRRLSILLCAAAAAIACVSGSSANAGVVTQVGTLTPGSSSEFVGVAASGSTVVGVGFGNAFVFSEPSTGWSSERSEATLEDNSGLTLQPTGAALDGDTAVLNAGNLGTPSIEDVFERPADGWHGTIQPVARLVASDGARLDDAAVSGRIVVALGIAPGASRRDLYVFTEPAGGWSGTITQTALLYDNGGADLASVAIAGATIVGGSVERADVFTEPASGWAGTTSQDATLTAPHDTALSPVAVAGSTIFAGTTVFGEPPGGWTNSASPEADLFPASGPPDESRGPEAFSETTATITATALGAVHECPCSGSIWLFTQPLSGWSGVISSPPALSGGDNNDVGILPTAVDGSTLFVGGNPSIGIYAIGGSFGGPPHPPHAQNVSVNGLANGKPTLRARIVAPNDAPPIETISIQLPRGLTLRTNRRHPLSGVAVSPATIAAHRGARRLTVTFAQSATKVRVTLTPRALVESKPLEQRSKRSRSPRQRASRTAHSPKLRVSFVIGELFNLRTQLTLVLKPLRR